MKNDLKHLRRSELIDLIYEMKKREIELQTRLDEAEAKLQAREITDGESRIDRRCGSTAKWRIPGGTGSC